MNWLRTEDRHDLLRYIAPYFLAITVVACGGDSSTAPISESAAAEAVSVGRIAFVSQNDGNQEIYVVNSDGTELLNFTEDPSNDGDLFPEADDRYGFTWSPDGTCIAFESRRDTRIQFFVQCFGDTVARALTTDTRLLSGSVPVWSPDGNRIAFVAGVGSRGEEVCVMNSDGSDPRCITDNNAFEVGVTWSPDGAHLGFLATGVAARLNNIHIVNPDGTELAKVADNASYDSLLGWSPDGTRVLYNSYWGANADIYIVEVDGSGATRLTDDRGMDVHPAWYPNGNQIAFSSSRSGGLDIYIMNSDGSDLTRITDDSAYEFAPAWSPDGSRLAFVSGSASDGEGEATNFDIYVVRADGSNRTLVAKDMAGYAVPIWAPSP